MCRVKCSVLPGLIAEEKVAQFQTIEGQEAVPLYSSLIIEEGGQSSFRATEIDRTSDKVLIQLPNESFSGRWRHIITPDQLVEA